MVAQRPVATNWRAETVKKGSNGDHQRASSPSEGIGRPATSRTCTVARTHCKARPATLHRLGCSAIGFKHKIHSKTPFYMFHIPKDDIFKHITCIQTLKDDLFLRSTQTHTNLEIYILLIKTHKTQSFLTNIYKFPL